MPLITEHIKLEMFEPENSWIRGAVYEFQVNPNSIQVTNEITVIESNYLRQDGGVVRPTQRKLKKITGAGKFFDIPPLPVSSSSDLNTSQDVVGSSKSTSNPDPFPLVVRSRSSKFNQTAFDMYKGLVSYMETKHIMRFSHQYLGEMYVIIQGITLVNGTSSNTVDFTFSLIETLIDPSLKTGFERDAEQQVPGLAVASRTDESDAVQYKTYKVVSGDTLSRIALKFYGKASLWGLIYDYNRDVLTRGPNVLSIGQILKIPISESTPYKVSGGVTPSVNYTVPTPVTITVAGSDTQLLQKTAEALDYVKDNVSQYIDQSVNSNTGQIFTTAFGAIFGSAPAEIKPSLQINLTGPGSILP